MVKALHRAGIEVILDVVFNHTAEGDQNGPTMSFRGIDNSAYYILDKDRSRYLDFSGCGNTFNTNHPATRRLIEDSLRYWVQRDACRRLSLRSRSHTLARFLRPPDAESARPLGHRVRPGARWYKVIAEAWDAAGLYEVGSFVGEAWKEWNGRFRDDVRSFFRGDKGTVRNFADRILGSSEIYSGEQREAEQSVNFITCHDGFTLNDLVSYNHKHNEANGEDNRDGGDDNRSWNHGVEGPTDDPAIETLRNRQVKTSSVTMLSLGMPMILMGDEVRRTQRGNNNAYCHDDESTWFNWTNLQKHPDVLRFVQLLASQAPDARCHRRATPPEPGLNSSVPGYNEWHGVKLKPARLGRRLAQPRLLRPSCQPHPGSPTSYSTPTGNRSTSNSPASPTAIKIPGTDGSTPHSPPLKTSSIGKPCRRFKATPTAQVHAL